MRGIVMRGYFLLGAQLHVFPMVKPAYKGRYFFSVLKMIQTANSFILRMN